MKVTVKDWLADTVMPWPDEHGRWEIALHWSPGHSGFDCTGFDLRLREAAEPEALTATRLRQVRLDKLVREGRRRKYAEVGGDLVEAYDAARAAGEEGESEVSVQLIDSLRREASDWSPPGRGPRLTEAHYREVAIVYSTALDAGGNPLRAVMKHPAWGPTSKPTASRWVARARAEGYLPPTGRGRARGNNALVPGLEGQR